MLFIKKEALVLSDGIIEDGLPRSLLSEPTKEVFFAIRSDQINGDGSPENPFSGNTTSLLDGNLASLGENTLIHLGPGVFVTSGTPAWRIKTGQWIVGAGQFNTVLRLRVAPQSAPRRVLIIAPNVAVHGVLISDLTLDPDLSGQKPYTGDNYAQLAADGIGGLRGLNNRVQRVRFINYGTRSGRYAGFTGEEAFTCNLGQSNAIVEDCIFEQPCVGTMRETTLINVGNDELLSSLPAVIRRCHIDTAYVNPRNGFAIKVMSAFLSYTDLVTVRTRFPHNVSAGDIIEMKGASDSRFNDRWEVTSPTLAAIDGSTTLEFRVLGFTPTLPPEGIMTVEESFLPTLRVEPVSPRSGTTIKFRTARPHKRKENDWVVINGADWNGSNVDEFNGTFKVKANPTATEFEIDLDSSGSSLPTGEIWVDKRFGRGARIAPLTPPATGTIWTLTTYEAHSLKPGEWFLLNGNGGNDRNNFYKALETGLGPKTLKFEPQSGATVDTTATALRIHFQAAGGHSGVGATVERNYISNCLHGADYHDTWMHADVIVRKNYHRNVYRGVLHHLGSDLPNPGVPSFTGSIIAKAAASGGLPNRVKIRATTWPLAGTVAYFYLQLTQSTRSERVKVLGDVDTSGGFYDFWASVSSTGDWLEASITYRGFTQQRRIVVDENIFDLPLIALPTGIAQAVPPQAALTQDFMLCDDLIARGNLIRIVDNNIEPNGEKNTGAVTFYNVNRAIVENNIIDGIQPATPSTRWSLTCGVCNSVRTFNNQTSAGTRMRLSVRTGYPGALVGVAWIQELADDVEDWLLSW